MSRLVLMKPKVKYPVKKQGYGGDAGVPLGLLYLAGYVRRQNDVEVSVVDYRLAQVQGIPRNLRKDINAADIVGVGACTSESPDALHILKKAKSMGKVTIMGGLYPTFNAKEVLDTGYVDYVVNGEGETGLSNLLEVLSGKKSLEQATGISYKKDGKIVQRPTVPIKDLITLPLPAYDLLPMKEYAQISPAGIYSARGCSMHCKFCTLNELWEFTYRRRSFDNVIEEIKTLKDFGFKRVHFKDETITLNRKWAMQLFSEIEQANLGISYKVKSRIDAIDQELLDQMMSAGVDTIHTGIESISQKTLDCMGKRLKVETIQKSFDLMLNSGCKVNPVYMFGWPGETPEDLEENANFITQMGKRPGVLTYVSFITPHPGSAFASELKDILEIFSYDYSRYTHKQPVAAPISLGPEGLELMVSNYDAVAESCGMRHLNPRVEQDYLDEIREHSKHYIPKNSTEESDSTSRLLEVAA